MRSFYSVLTALMLSLSATGVVEATDLYTSPLFVAANDRFECLIANLSPVTRMVQIQVKSNGGSSLFDTGSIPLPGGSVGDGSFTDGGAGIYCQFTVQGSKKFYRASGTVRLQNSNTTILSVPAE